MNKKLFRKISAVILGIALMFTLLLPAFAQSGCTCGKTPVIFVSGFGASYLSRVYDDGSEEVVFPPSTDQIKNAITSSVEKFTKQGGNITKDKEYRVLLHDIIYEILDPIGMNSDGTSKYNLKPVYSSVEDTSYEGFVRNNATKYIPYGDSDFLNMKSAAEAVGADHAFNFLFDWRKSGDEVADELLSYIEDVCEHTGHDKVSIYCLSQGSVPVAQYLYKYADKCYIDNLVFDNPIFDGSYFVSDFLNGKDGTYSLEIDEMLDLLENIIHTEFDISKILGALPDDKIVPFVNTEVKLAGEDVIFPVAVNAPAYLEMIPEDKFAEVSGEYFSKEVIEKAIRVMYGYRSDIQGTLRTAEGYGANISIVASSGENLVTGTHIQSDAIVNLSSSCGAICSENAEPFPMDYEQMIDTGCNNISPDRTIDLSTGYIPEKTWILNERYHGQVEWSPLSCELMETLLFTDDLTDAYCNARFPQFIQSDDPGQNVWASFENTNSLYGVQNTSGTVIIKNTSNSNRLLIESITVTGAKATYTPSCPIRLAPGETTYIELDTSGVTLGKITVSYSGSDVFFAQYEKEFTFSITDNYSGMLTSDKTEITVQNILSQLAAKVWSIVNKLLNTVFGIVKKISL